MTDQARGAEDRDVDITPHSGDLTCEYEVYKILSTLKKTSPGID